MKSLAYPIWAVVFAAAAGVMAFLPLVGLLGFESSFVIGAIAAFAGAHLGARAVARRREEQTRSDGERADARPIAEVLWLWAAEAARLVALLLVPLGLLAANALRVKNCNLLAGAWFFVGLPVMTALTSTAAGTVAGLATKTRRRGITLAIGIVLASVAWGTLRFYSAPPVFAFDPFAGWFPGSIYDEELALDGTFWIARGVHALGILAALVTAAALLDGPVLRLQRPRRWGHALLALALVSSWAIARELSQPRIAPTAESIAKTLGGRRETPHLVLLYDPAGPWGKEIELYAADAEFRFAEIEAALGPRANAGRITCFLFGSAAEKRRLMGAANTQIAKPWRREIYVQFESFPHGVWKHELVHAYAGDFGDSLFGVARHGVGMNVGLVEGLAVAVGDRPGRLTLDEQVKAMRVLGLQPPLARVFGLGFFGEPPARAYTVAGSFVRFLLDEGGPDKVRRLYLAGGTPASFREIYGRSFEDLEAAWSKRVDAAAVDERDRSLAAEHLKRPSVFRRTCAHELAVRREHAYERAGRGDHAGAIALLQRICDDEPNDPEPLLAVMDEEAAAGHEADAERTAREVLARPEASDSQQARALLFLGDARLRAERRVSTGDARQALAILDAPAAAKGSDDEAADAPTADAKPPETSADYYRRALALHLDEDFARQFRARLIAVSDPRVGPPLALYLAGDGQKRDAALDLLRARDIVEAAPDDGLGHYLLGRMFYNHERFAEAEKELGEATFLGLPPGGFTVAALNLQGLAALRARLAPAAAQRIFQRLVDLPEADAATRRVAAEFVDRCRFFDEHPDMR